MNKLELMVQKRDEIQSLNLIKEIFKNRKSPLLILKKINSII